MFVRVIRLKQLAILAKEISEHQPFPWPEFLVAVTPETDQLQVLLPQSRRQVSLP